MRRYAEMKYGKIHSIFPAENYKSEDFTPEQVKFVLSRHDDGGDYKHITAA